MQKEQVERIRGRTRREVREGGQGERTKRDSMEERTLTVARRE
jgi:hypothetical protein